MSKVWTPEDIKEFERFYIVDCTRRLDGFYYVQGSITINSYKVKSLLDVLPPIHTLNGNLDICFTAIEDLIGAPMRINCFSISSNWKLKTLEGAPEFIGKSFWCNDNSNLIFTQSQLNAMNIQGSLRINPEQLIPNDPAEYIEKGILPI